MTTEESDKRRLTAILHADAKGYSRLMAEDDSFTVRTLTAYRQVMADLIQQYRGRVINAPGDALLAEFVSVLDAVKCAVEIQEELKKRNADLPENRKMQFRIGVNLGDVIEEGEDIHGDGVNISARVEALADGGGICITRSAYDQVKKKLANLGYEYIGAHDVKNISEPVRVYRVLMEPEFAGKVIGEEIPKPGKWPGVAVATVVILIIVAGVLAVWNFYFRPPPIEVASVEKMAFPLPDKQSIAVLPFDNMSKDPEQEYFADGISEDLITDLSKIPDLLVISRLSSFTYKGKKIKVQQIAEELGVRYVLEGSVRKAENRVRINAQLIDGATGHHLWADRYDGDMKDIFALQDEITRKIAASLAVKLTKGAQDRPLHKVTNNMEAYEAYLKGAAIADSLRYDPERFAEALTWFEKATELDPDYNRAYAALAETYLFGSEFGIQSVLGISSRLARMRGMNYLQMAMMNPTEIAHRIAARLYTSRGQHEKAIDHGMRAIALAPNAYRSNGFMALTMIYAGRPDEGIPFAERMRRADPACLW
jgi:TolB-like protein/class 3 adenylate cyclase